MADLTDRHYALFANNQHPMQLDIYENYNRMLRVLNSEEHQTRMQETRARMAEVKEERSKLLNQEEGETLSTDDMADIYM